MVKIWVNSADSHVLEPHDLWRDALPKRLADRAPRAERADGRETVYVDGQIIRRDPIAFSDAMRPPGAEDPRIRLEDLDEQGVWAEVVFPSRALWTTIMTDRELARECGKAYNDWCLSEVMGVSPRFVGVAVVSVLDTDDAVAELARAVSAGYRAVFLPATPPEGRDFNNEVWEPLWAAAAEADIPICFHIGTGAEQKVARGPGGAVINYVETFYPAQRTVAHLVASGVLDRYPGLRIVMAESGATFVPALADRMDEAYRQHDMFVRPKLSRRPSEIIYSQVYASFQHDPSAIGTATALGFRNVMWGSDYPHLEGTFPNTQKVLHELFDDVAQDVRRRITIDCFNEVFGVAEPPVTV
ncbi:amidohydrolase family protein [Frankia sp. Cr1]|uniref:amidohydrolase family protein n=1 Tax=Frankia sp. Cr1 TaxID=3073931 RepID=UPI002AD35722|nr:amidohydrolase family protein [Frankia sp. Cr1]